MLKIEILAVGRLKTGPYFDMCREYAARMNTPLSIHEIESRHKDAAAMMRDENEKLRGLIQKGAFVVAMDRRGKNISSLDLASTTEKQRDSGTALMQFIIGGADGLDDETLKKANMCLSFGNATWPHMLARVMLMEQIYRAQQILAKHPYHRE